MAPHSVAQKTVRKRALGLLFLLFILSIFIRLPNLNRPGSKHYEFNTAVVMINIISWRQNGGGGQLNYTPVINFQHAGDKLPPNNLNIDKAGNTVYLSYGPGMFIIPYFFYQWLKLPAIPVYLEILNLIFHLSCIILLFYSVRTVNPANGIRQIRYYNRRLLLHDLFSRCTLVLGKRLCQYQHHVTVCHGRIYSYSCPC
ncbi:MAG: hypothetical protein WDM78_23550 [Puia sp.]